MFALLLLPGLWLALRWGLSDLGARPLKAAIHSTGYWALWLLLGSLAITPFKAIAGNPNVVVLRRMVGLASLAYALIHITLWLTEENWRLLHAASEIVLRFYLTIGAAVFTVLLVLGVTSTDKMARRLGPRWKTLHKTVYAAAALAMVHYYLQSKADVSQAVIASGVLTWLLLWRVLPSGRDRSALPILGLAAAAGLLALAFEFTWYWSATHVDAFRVLRAEANPTYGLHPAALVFAYGLVVTAAVALHQFAGTRAGTRAGAALTILLYTSGALWAGGASAALGLGIDDPPDPSAIPMTLLAAAAFALLGLARYRAQHLWWRHALDALLVTSSLYPLLLQGDGENRQIIVGLAGVLVTIGLALSSRLWSVSRGMAFTLLPLFGWLTGEVLINLTKLA